MFFLDECARLAPFTNVGKAVFHVEYEVGVDEFCASTTDLGFSSMPQAMVLARVA